MRKNAFQISITTLLFPVLLFFSFQHKMQAQCTISNVNVETGDCIEANYYSFTLNFNIAENPTDSFNISLNGAFYGAYSLEDLPLTIEEFGGHVSGLDTLEICAIGAENCCAETIIETPCTCDYFNIERTITECSEDSIWFNLDFDYLNVSDSFLIGAPPTGFLGTHHVNELPLYNLVLPIEDTISVLISDQNNIFCFNAFELYAAECDQCIIQNVEASTTACTEENIFYVSIAFEHLNAPSDAFSIRGNGNYYGDFLYDFSNPLSNGLFYQEVTLDFAFPGDCETTWEFLVYDNNVDECADFVVIDPVCCEEDCTVGEILVSEVECLNQTMISFYLDFSYENPGNELFELYSGDDYFGTFALNELPLQINEFPINADETIMTVCINDQENCCEEYVFYDLDCTECSIFDLVVDGVECLSAEYFQFWLNFEYQNAVSEYFNLYSGDELVATYLLEELPVFVEEFPVGDGEHPSFTVCINDMEDCCYEKVFYDLDCGEADCEMSDIDYEIIYTSADSFLVQLDFEVYNPVSELFSVRGNGKLYGYFNYESLPVILGLFDCQDSVFLEFVVRDLERESCFSVLELGLVDCLVNTQRTEMKDVQVFSQQNILYIRNYDTSFGRSKLHLYNQVGQRLRAYELDGRQEHYELALPSLQNAMYYIHIFNEEHRSIRKLNILR